MLRSMKVGLTGVGFRTGRMFRVEYFELRYLAWKLLYITWHLYFLATPINQCLFVFSSCLSSS